MSGSDQDRNRRLSWGELQAANDLELIQQVVWANDDALAVIVDRYQRLVFSIAMRIVKDEGEAEDIVQTVFVDCFKKAEQFDPSRGTLKMWLLQSAYGRSINRRHYLEHRQFYSALDFDDVNPLDFSGTSLRHDRLSPEESSRLVRQALGSLNKKQSTAIELVYFEGLTLEEAARRANESLPAIRHQYYRGLMKLREIIYSAPLPRAKEADAIRLEMAHVKPRPI